MGTYSWTYINTECKYVQFDIIHTYMHIYITYIQSFVAGARGPSNDSSSSIKA